MGSKLCGEKLWGGVCGVVRQMARAGRITAGCAGLLVCLGLLLAGSSNAATVPSSVLWRSAEPGTSAGSAAIPRGVAADPDSGRVYVADHGNNRINEFTAWGEFVKAWGWGVLDGSAELQMCTTDTGCQAGLAGDGPGQLDRPGGLVVVEGGSIFVADRGNLRVQKFGSDGGFQLMLGGQVDQGPIHPGNRCTAQYIEEGDVCGTGLSGTGQEEFSIWPVGSYVSRDALNNIYVGDTNRIQVFDAAGVYLSSLSLPSEGSVASLAVDVSTGDIYFSFPVINEAGVAQFPGVFRLSAGTGSLKDTLAVDRPSAIAADPEGNVYVAREPGAFLPSARSELLVFDADGQLVGSGEGAATDLISSSGIGTNVVGAEGQIGVYVSNSRNEGGFVQAYLPAPSFWPPPPAQPVIIDQYATSVDAKGATVRATINPRFWSDTRYYVEYGTDPCEASACQKLPAPPGSLLTSKVISAPLTSAGVFLEGLVPNTTYHYRFVAESSGGGPVSGAEATFTTPPLSPVGPPCPNDVLRPGAGGALPDCRAYEMVSPIDKEGADIWFVFTDAGDPAGLDQAAPAGSTITYSAYRAFADPKSAPYTSQYLARRGRGRLGERIDLATARRPLAL